MYELTVPNAEPIEGDERHTSAGITLTGAAVLPSNVKGNEIRARIDEFRAGNTAPPGNLTVSWALVIKAKPLEPGPVKNPAAQPIQVNGLSGIEVRGPGSQLHWAFAAADHSLMISVRGPAERIDSPEVRTILNSLRCTGPVPPDLARRAVAASQVP
jgi:hypothetical protein